MRRINSDFQTLHISEEGQKLSNRDYFGYVEMDDFACYVLADSLDDEPAVNSARLVVDSIIRDFTEAPTMGKGTLRRYLLRAHTELLKQRAGMHLKVAVVVAVTDYRTLRYCHVGQQPSVPDPERPDSGTDEGPVADAESAGTGTDPAG